MNGNDSQHITSSTVFDQKYYWKLFHGHVSKSLHQCIMQFVSNSRVFLSWHRRTTSFTPILWSLCHDVGVWVCMCCKISTTSRTHV